MPYIEQILRASTMLSAGGIKKIEYRNRRVSERLVRQRLTVEDTPDEEHVQKM